MIPRNARFPLLLAILYAVLSASTRAQETLPPWCYPKTLGAAQPVTPVTATARGVSATPKTGIRGTQAAAMTPASALVRPHPRLAVTPTVTVHGELTVTLPRPGPAGGTTGPKTEGGLDPDDGLPGASGADEESQTSTFALYSAHGGSRTLNQAEIEAASQARAQIIAAYWLHFINCWTEEFGACMAQLSGNLDNAGGDPVKIRAALLNFFACMYSRGCPLFPGQGMPELPPIPPPVCGLSCEDFEACPIELSIYTQGDGGNPDIMEVFPKTADGAAPGSMWFASPKSPSQFYLYPQDGKRYVERSDPDGTVAVYLVIPQPMTGHSFMRLEKLRDSYDNETVFTYSGDTVQLLQIDYPSGIREKYNYAPDWIVNDTTWNHQTQGLRYGVEVTYENLALGSAGDIADLTWGWYAIIQRDANGDAETITQHYYYPKSPALAAADSQQNYATPYNLAPGMALLRPVYEVRLERAPFNQHVGTRYKLTTIHESRSANHLPGANRELVLSNEYQVAAGFLRVSQQVDRYGQVHQFEYTQGTLPNQQPYANSITHVMPHGTREALAVDTLGRVTSRTATPTDDASGRPRAYESGQPGPAEPVSMTWTYGYASACGCGRPTSIVIPGPGSASARTFDFTYDTRTGRMSTATVPNPSNVQGAPAKIMYEWTYTHGMANPPSDAFLNRALPETFTVRNGTGPSDPTQTWVFNYPLLFGRTTPRHGVKPEIVAATSPVVSLEGGGTHQIGSVAIFDSRGRILSRSAGGEGERVIYSYPQGKTLPDVVALEASGGGEQVRTEFTFDDWGRLVQTIANAGSSLALMSTHTRASTGELLVLSQSNPLGADPELRLFYDVWGNVCATESLNKTSSGAAPQSIGQAGPGAREYVRREAKFLGPRLLTELTERRPLFADNSGPAIDDPDARMLLTTYAYGTDGLLERVILGNDSERLYVRDGYGTIFREEAVTPGVSGTQILSKTYVDAALDPIQLHVHDGTTNLVTAIERSPLGLALAAVDPTTPVPQGYSGSTGGGRHEADYDHMGRVVALRTRDGSAPSDALLAETAFILDEIGRVRRREDTILGAGASGTISEGYRYNRSSQVTNTYLPGGRTLETSYDALGRLVRQADGPGTDVNAARAEYYAGTLLKRHVRRDVWEEQASGGSLKTYSAEFVRDHLGLVTQAKSLGTGGATPVQVWTADYNTFGNIERVVDPLLREHRASWDALGRQVELAALGAGPDMVLNTAVWTDWSGDAGKTTVRRTDDRGLTTQHISDALGRLTTVLNPGADHQNPPSETTPYKEHTYFAQYDGASRVKHVYDGRGVKLTHFYNGLGQLLVREATVLPGGVSGMATREVYQVDRLGRVTASGTYTGPIGPTMAPVGIVAFAQDSIGRFHGEDYAYGIGGSNISEVSTRYGATDPLLRNGLDFAGITANDAIKLDFAHDLSARLDQVDWTLPGTQTTQLAAYRHSLGSANHRALTYAPSASGDTQVSFDAYARTSQILDTIGSTELSRFDFGYSSANELLLESYLKPSTGYAGGGDRFVLDPYGRMKDSWLGLDQAGMNPLVLPDENTAQYARKLTYTLDDASNREEVRRKDGAAGVPGITDYVPESTSNRYSSIIGEDQVAVGLAHDAAGNLAFDGLFYYVYDYKNRLSEVYIAVPGPTGDAVASASRGSRIRVRPTEQQLRTTSGEIRSRVANLRILARDHAKLRSAGKLTTTSTMGLAPMTQEVTLQLVALYGYDPLDRRVIRIVSGVGTYLYAYDGAREVAELEPIDIGGTVTNAPRKAFVWGDRLDELLVYATSNGSAWTPYFAHQGRHDSVVRLLEASGNPVEAIEYDPFGRGAVYANSTYQGAYSTVGNPYLWNAKRADPETGLIYNRLRYLSPEQGRFLTLDPIGVWGDPYGSGNGYAYGGNNPATLVDVNGDCPIIVIVWIIVLASGGTFGVIFGPEDVHPALRFLGGAAVSGISFGAGSLFVAGGAALNLTATYAGSTLIGAGGGFVGYGTTSLLTGSPMTWQGITLSVATGGAGGAFTRWLVPPSALGAPKLPAVATQGNTRACATTVSAGGQTVSTCPVVILANTIEDLKAAATQAHTIVGPGQGAVHGTLVHSAFRTQADALRTAAGLRTETSYMAGRIVPYGTRGSIRADAVLGNPMKPLAVFDLKTGAARLSDGRIERILSQLPDKGRVSGGYRVPVIEIR